MNRSETIRSHPLKSWPESAIDQNGILRYDTLLVAAKNSAVFQDVDMVKKYFVLGYQTRGVEFIFVHPRAWNQCLLGSIVLCLIPHHYWRSFIHTYANIGLGFGLVLSIYWDIFKVPSQISRLHSRDVRHRQASRSLHSCAVRPSWLVRSWFCPWCI